MKKRKNKGSAVIELSLLIPFLLGVVYLYIMMFLFFVTTAKGMDIVAEQLYIEDDKETSEQIQLRTEGEAKIGRIEEEGKIFTIRVELRRDKNNPVKNIRRWQLVGDVF